MERDDGLPVLEEASERVWEAVQGGQPVLLTRRGRPAVVALDVETYATWEEEFQAVVTLCPSDVVT